MLSLGASGIKISFWLRQLLFSQKRILSYSNGTQVNDYDYAILGVCFAYGNTHTDNLYRVLEGNWYWVLYVELVLNPDSDKQTLL